MPVEIIDDAWRGSFPIAAPHAAEHATIIHLILGAIRMDAAQEELSFTYFPDNYRWSHGLLIGLNMAPWGGAEIGEVNRSGLRLKTSVGDDNAWFREWSREAHPVEDRGRERIAG